VTCGVIARTLGAFCFARGGQSLSAKTMKAYLIDIPVGAHHVQATQAGTRHRVANASSWLFLAAPKPTQDPNDARCPNGN
jgi:hypothetical protein